MLSYHIIDVLKKIDKKRKDACILIGKTLFLTSMFWSGNQVNDQFERLTVKQKNGYKRTYNQPIREEEKWENQSLHLLMW